MQKLRKLLPLMLVIALVITAIVAISITASAENITVDNVWLAATPYSDVRAKHNSFTTQYAYYPSATFTSATGARLLGQNNSDGWGAHNKIATLPIGSTDAAVQTNNSTTQFTIYKLADSVDRRAVDALWGLPVVLTIDSETNEVVDVALKGTMLAVTSDRIDAAAYSASPWALYYLDGEQLTGVNNTGKRLSVNFSSGGFFTSYPWQDNYNTGKIDAENNRVFDNAGKDITATISNRFNLVNEKAPDIFYLVDTDGNGTYDWNFMRPVLRGTLKTANPGTEVSLTFPSEANASNGNNYTSTGVGGSAWFTGTSTQHYWLGESRDEGAVVGTEYFAIPSVTTESTGYGDLDLIAVGSAVADTFKSVSIKEGATFKTLAEITPDMIDATALVYGRAEAIPTVTAVAPTGNAGEVLVTATYLGEEITGTISGIEVIELTGIKIATNSLLLSNAGITADMISVYAVYNNGNEVLLPTSAYTVAAVEGTNDEISVTATDELCGTTLTDTTKLFYYAEKVLTATPLRNLRGEDNTNTNFKMTADGVLAKTGTNSQPILLKGKVGNYDINKCIALADIQTTTANPTLQTIYEYNGDIAALSELAGLPVKVYFADKAMTEVLNIELLGEKRVFSLRDSAYDADSGKYYFGAEEVSIEAGNGRMWSRNNAQHLRHVDIKSTLRNCVANNWTEAGNIIMVDTDGNGKYDWMFYDPIYTLTGTTLSANGTKLTITGYTGNKLPHSADVSISVVNWFDDGNMRFGVHGGLTTVDASSNVYGRLYLDVAGSAANHDAYWILENADDRFTVTSATPTGNTVEGAYVAGDTLDVSTLPLIYLTRNDGSTVKVALTEDMITSDLTLAEADTSKQITATVEGCDIDFTVSGFSVVTKPSKIRVSLTDAAPSVFTNGDAITKDMLFVEYISGRNWVEVEGYYELTTTVADLYAKIDHDNDESTANVPAVTVTYLGLTAHVEITVVPNIKQFVLVATYNDNFRYGNTLALGAADKVAVYPFGAEYAAGSLDASKHQVLSVADGVTVENELAGLPITVELDVNGKILSMVACGTSTTVRTGDIEVAANDDETYTVTLNGEPLAINPLLFTNASYGLVETTIFRNLATFTDGHFSGNNDNVITLVDMNNDGEYDFAKCTEILNGSVVYEVGEKSGYNYIKVGATMGSHGSTGWIQPSASSTQTFYYELAEGVDTPKVGDYVNFEMHMDKALSGTLGWNSGNGTYPTKLIITSIATPVEGLATKVSKSESLYHINFYLNGELTRWTNVISTTDYADGASGVNAGRTTFATNNTYTYIKDECGFVVRVLESNNKATGLEVEAAAPLFNDGQALTTDLFTAYAVYGDGSKQAVTEFTLDPATATLGMTTVNATATIDGAEYVIPVEINVYKAETVSITRTYFQIKKGTTAESASSDIRFVAGVSGLECSQVGFVFSLNDAELALDYLNSDTFKKLSWKIVVDGDTFRLIRATDASTNKTYFKLITNQVFDSINADGAVITTADLALDSGYLFAVTFTGVPASHFDSVFTARTFTVAGGTTTYCEEVKSATINDMITQ